MAEPIISVSGLRGIVGETLTPEVAIRYAAAFSSQTPAGSFVVTQDGRASGAMLAQAMLAGLAAVGRDTIDVGIAATPTTGVLIRGLGAAGGIQISASHNPSPYNGMKLFSAEGRVIPESAGRRVLAQYRTGGIAWAPHDRLGRSLPCGDSVTLHLEKVLATVDVEAIRRRRFRVLLDSNHGAGSILGRNLLESLGCTLALLGGEPDGRFEHTPEPTAENLAGVSAEVVRAGADVGFCQDPDADRLAVIDEHGRYIGEEYTLALCVDNALQKAKGPIVTNCSTSRMSEDVAARFGVPLIRSAVGEANVVDRMMAENAVFGGEGNGGPIDPAVGWVRDSFVGMARILESMAASGRTVGQLADALPRYYIVKTKITLAPERVPAALDRLAAHFADAAADRLDGLRLDWPGRWLLVRPSNTEPIVRAIAEAASAEEAEGLCRDAARVIDGGIRD